MESLVANGGTTFTKTAKIKDGGLYSTNLHPAQIHITFNSNPALNKVNGEFYVNPIEQYTVDDTPPSNYYGPEAKGWLKFKSNDSAYPNFIRILVLTMVYTLVGQDRLQLVHYTMNLLDGALMTILYCELKVVLMYKQLPLMV